MLHLRDEVNCGSGGGSNTHFHLRIASIFIILAGSGGGALFPVLVKRSKRISLPGYLFEFVYPGFPAFPSS
jgi:zinc transporter 1/2/3